MECTTLRTCEYTYDSSGNMVSKKETGGSAGTVTTASGEESGKAAAKAGAQSQNTNAGGTGTGELTDGNATVSGQSITAPAGAVMTYSSGNRLLTYNGSKVEYDADGNMTHGPLDGTFTKMEYDCRNRLIRAGNTTYEYDAGNNRIAKEEENSKGTVLTTDADGKEIHRFAYGTYGELLNATEQEIKEVRFLYNGKYGVETDTKGLYYMRARYYNTDIRRFLNMDTVKGDMKNTQSLNRYAYVEGNPVNLFDPFGLSPMDSDGWMRLLHSTLNILGFIPGSVGMVMDAVNAAIYLCEGDYANAICSAVSIGCGVGGSLLAKFGGKAGKTAVNIFQAGSGAYGAVMCVSNAVKGAAAIKKEYQENGGHITLNMVCNAMSVLENGVGFYMSGKSFASGAKGLKSSGFGKGLKGFGFGSGLKNRIAGLGKKIKDSVKRMDNGSYLDLSRLGRNSGTQRRILYHYTNEKGMNAIIESQKLNPSLKSNNPNDARYGNGQYLSDIQPEIYSPAQLAKRFINVPNKYRYTHYVEIDVTGLEVIQGREGVFVIQNESPLDLVGRIVGTGKVGKV